VLSFEVSRKVSVEQSSWTAAGHSSSFIEEVQETSQIHHGKNETKNHIENIIAVEKRRLRRVFEERLNRRHYTDNLRFGSYLKKSANNCFQNEQRVSALNVHLLQLKLAINYERRILLRDNLKEMS
jgi:hypothetical protein